MNVSDSAVRSTVKEKYGQAAQRVSEGANCAFVRATKPLAQCCGPDCC
jgi:hypothetical protein